jgi:hypothetical protein
MVRTPPTTTPRQPRPCVSVHKKRLFPAETSRVLPPCAGRAPMWTTRQSLRARGHWRLRLCPTQSTSRSLTRSDLFPAPGWRQTLDHRVWMLTNRWSDLMALANTHPFEAWWTGACTGDRTLKTSSLATHATRHMHAGKSRVHPHAEDTGYKRSGRRFSPDHSHQVPGAVVLKGRLAV